MFGDTTIVTVGTMTELEKRILSMRNVNSLSMERNMVDGSVKVRIQIDDKVAEAIFVDEYEMIKKMAEFSITNNPATIGITDEDV